MIDTNVIIDWLGSKFRPHQMDFLNEIIDQTPVVSIITKIELLGFDTSPDHEALLKDFIGDSSIVNLSDQVVDKCIEIRKTSKIKLPDAVIASTAMIYEHALLTRNTADFSTIKGLKVLNPHLI